MKKTKKYLLGGLILLVLLLLAGVVGFFRMRHILRTTHPLVLVQNPLNGERISHGEGIIAHATARSPNGVKRIELWINDVLVDSRDSPDGEARTPLVLSSSWTPSTLGGHVIVVRATSKEGAEGQASVLVHVVKASHRVVEGQTMESIAEDYGLDPEDLMDLNPMVDPEDLSPGDSLNLPEGDFEPTPGGSGDGTPPDPLDPPPGSTYDVLEEVGLRGDEPAQLGDGQEEGQAPGTLGLRVEALGLETTSAYASLHCYVSAAELAPAWYPDTDDQQSTDESFDSADGLSWDVAAHLSGEAAFFIYWPQDDPLPIQITCVGTQPDGTNSDELGMLELNVPPEEWDGEARVAIGMGEEGGFALEYRVTWEEGARTVIASDENDSMTPPTNLSISAVDRDVAYLMWDYEPEPDEGPIHGFLVFLNDTLVWIEPADTRLTVLPYQWFTPPCGTDYVFTLRAYQRPYPRGDYSPASEPEIVSSGELGDPGCEREYVVTFTTLATYDLGGDGDEDPGDVGPVFGDFYVNDQITHFEGYFCESGVICHEAPFSLYHNSTRDISNFPWDSGDSNQLVVTLDDWEDLSIGFDIDDKDTGIGWNRWNDNVCGGETVHYFGDVVSGRDFEGAVLSTEAEPRCRVDYTIRPLRGSPVGSGPEIDVGGDDIPLPWLELVDVTLEPEGTQLQFHIRNIGSADWVAHDIEIELVKRGEGTHHHLRWPVFRLDVGETVILSDPDLPIIRPHEACVTLDPVDKVLELYEFLGTAEHTQDCPPLPDLIINHVEQDEGTGDLHVTVQNYSAGELQRNTLQLRITHDDGSTLDWLVSEEVTLGPNDTYVVVWPRERLRPELMDGYTITIDPEDRITEADEYNNDFIVRDGVWLYFEWTEASFRWDPGPDHEESCSRDGRTPEESIRIELEAETSLGSRHITGWTIRDLDCCDDDVSMIFDEPYALDIELAGDETLVVNMSIEYTNGEEQSDRLRSYPPTTDWSYFGIGGTDEAFCPGRPINLTFTPVFYDARECGIWSVEVKICEIEE